MERSGEQNKFHQEKAVNRPCEIPRQNGTKPSESLKIQEECKKHIRRDGKR